MNIEKMKAKVAVKRYFRNAQIAVLVILIANFIFTVLAVNYAGKELVWTLVNKGKVDREIVRVNKLAVEGRIVSPIPLE